MKTTYRVETVPYSGPYPLSYEQAWGTPGFYEPEGDPGYVLGVWLDPLTADTVRTLSRKGCPTVIITSLTMTDRFFRRLDVESVELVVKVRG